MELKWSQNDIKIDQKTMSKKHRKNDGQKSQHRANLAPKSLPKMATLFGVNVQDGGPRPLQDPSRSPSFAKLRNKKCKTWGGAWCMGRCMGRCMGTSRLRRERVQNVQCKLALPLVLLVLQVLPVILDARVYP